MAIIVEEEKRGSGILTFITWVTIIGVIGFASYFVFFKQPEIIDIVVPPEFEDIEEISKAELRPEAIESDPVFNSLKQYVTLPKEGEVGRSNPFLPF